jgi:hypothetical protein
VKPKIVIEEHQSRQHGVEKVVSTEFRERFQEALAKMEKARSSVAAHVRYKWRPRASHIRTCKSTKRATITTEFALPGICGSYTKIAGRRSRSDLANLTPLEKSHLG